MEKEFIKNIFPLKFINFLLVIVFAMLNSCTEDPIPEEKLEAITQNISFKRFEKELFEEFEGSKLATANNSKDLEYFKETYGGFFTLFSRNIIQIGYPDDPAFNYSLGLFVNDKTIQEVYGKVNETFPNTDDLENELNNAFKRYLYFFPDSSLPQVLTMISGFNYGIITTDEYLGISLDMYLGSDCEYYDMLGIPKYKSLQMNKENIVPSAVKGWISTSYDFDVDDKKLIELMVFEGKMLYLLDVLLPKHSDEYKIGYTKEEMEWCEKNEANIWAHFIEEELLFSAVFKQINKYVNEAPFTPGFVRESPGRLAHWIGWQIVRKTMKKNPQITVQQLMEMPAEEVLKISKYKPRF
jgi:hypothetical protein